MKDKGIERVPARLSGVMSAAMGFVLALSLAAAALVLAPDGASAMTSGELLRSCRAVTETAGKRDGATLEIPAAGLGCWYYMSAMQNMSVLVDESGVHLLGVCPPPASTVLDFVRIFVRATRRQRAAVDNAAALVVPELAKAYPCGGRD